jgi:hypothetical protein
MNLHLPFSKARDTAAIAALRDETIVLRTQVTFLQSMLESKATRTGPYRTREVRKDAKSFQRARANVIEQLKQAVERGV